MSAGLCAMVARITLRKMKHRDAWPVMEQLAKRADELSAQLTALAQEDADAYGEVIAALRQPRDSGGDASLRAGALQKATAGAAEVPMHVLRACEELGELASRAVKHGCPVASTDAASAASLALAAAQAAAFNVRVNLHSMTDESYVGRTDAEVSRVLGSVRNLSSGVHETVTARLKKG
jgi:formiminotetrahydrofolate cyclodeaminase